MLRGVLRNIIACTKDYIAARCTVVTLHRTFCLPAVQGRQVLWGWVQERRKVHAHSYAGCVSLPRLLHLTGASLFQLPLPEVAELRKPGRCWSARGVDLRQGEPLGVTGPVSGDMQLAA